MVGKTFDNLANNFKENRKAVLSGLESTRYSRKKQILAALGATLTCILNGCVIGYTGKMINGLKIIWFLVYS